MFTDMVGYTASVQADETGALRLLQEQEEIVRPVLSAHRGREIKSTGDGFLVEFDSALRAVQCAIEIHRRLHVRNAQDGVTPIQLRIGIHLGDVEERGRDIFGDAVNIASRIETIAEPGGICVSSAVQEQVRNKIPETLEKLKPRNLKGVETAIDVYRVVLPWRVFPSPRARPALPRLAVLPFTNISPDPADDYFADGLTEEVISHLSNLRGLRVIARSSVAQYKSTTKPVTQIGSELDVASVIEGSVRKVGNRIRITLQLIDTGTQEHLWSHRYDREIDDVFAIQSDIAERTAGALRLEMADDERTSIHKMPTTNVAAHDLFLQGVAALQSADPMTGRDEAMKLFAAAIKEDPDFSLAYSYLANAYISASGEAIANKEAFARAKGLLIRALELDPNSSEAHSAQGNLALQQEQNWLVAEEELKRAISLKPSTTSAYHWYSWLLIVTRRFDEAKEILRKGMDLDPFNVLLPNMLIYAFYCAREFPSAIALAEAARDRQPDSPRYHVMLGGLYADIGRMDDARREAEKCAGAVGKYLRRPRAMLWARLGKPEEARLLAEEMEKASRTEFVEAADLAEIYSELGDSEKAFEWLQRDFSSGDRNLWANYQSTAFDPIRNDPRFQRILQKMNLA